MKSRGKGLIPAGVDIGEDICLWISLSRGASTEMLKIGLDTSVIEANKIWRKREGGRG